MFKNLKGQISFEFSIIVLAVLLMSTITLSYFLGDSFSEDTRTLDKIDLGAKTAVSLVNSGYNGTHVNGTVIYAGMTFEESGGKYNVTLYLINTSSLNFVSNFIVNYVVNSQNIDNTKFNITLSTLNS
ncbi:conserved hypothetical protein [Methanococcus vannielii SB]|uniref:Class III signal peptide-containing protein n=1 Tax=Methanococcus vannielii (strain ATCC 35089 / DSM 1224 / JCM 13029 / OCM 148 / SB) TaxID=406327 RepID=A6URM1_METVS|nr:class III signal peptide-containing protein [Methanococcus vannielii]ABR55143.1 conserved hypothetical protein [Methanococcus vannielii SB]